MIRRIRVELTYANVAATLALFLAVSGGAAYAASHYLITSTKQIKPSVLKSLKGKTGPAGANGAPGPQGPQGATGTKGEPGTPGAPGGKGETGPAGTPGKEGAPGKEGKEGSPWTAGGTLPSGKTETGTWAVHLTEVKGSNEAVDTISFPIPVNIAEAERGQGVFITEAEAGSGREGCTGTVEAPTAPAGKLCVYTQSEKFKGLTGIPDGHITFDEEFGFGRPGAYLKFSVAEREGILGEAVAEGSWAVTAP
jgi:hypothetical protein